MGKKRITKEDLKYSFSGLPDNVKETVMEIVANFHYRDGVKYDDGSLGTVQISPAQLNDALAYAMRCREGERLE